jgi:hypothetical protein
MAVTAEQSASLTDAITKAVEGMPQGEQTQESPNEQTQENDNQEQSTQTESTQSEPADKNAAAPAEDEETIQGRNLVRALKDPERAAILIDFLAKQAGYTKAELKEVASPAEQREVTQDLQKILEEELGDELKFLAPKLGKALDRYLKDLKPEESVKSEVEEIRARLEAQERDKIEQVTLRTHAELSKQYFNADDMPDNVLQEMSKAMDKFPPASNVDPGEYYRDIFTYVAGKLNLQPKTQKQGERIARNRADAPARNLSATDRGVTPNASGGNPKKLSLDESIRLAVGEVEQKSSGRT